MLQMLFRRNKDNLARRRGQVKRTANIERLENRQLMAATPELFSDINTGTLPSNPYGFTELNGDVYFFATDQASAGDYAPQLEPLPAPIYDPRPSWPVLGPAPLRDIDLWKTDGTAAGTVRVKDLPPSREYPDQLIVAGKALYFAAFSAATGTELWKSDGTSAGTVLVKDIWPGTPSSTIFDLAAAGEQVFFSANDGQHGWDLWKSDGTADGTALVRDFANNLLSFTVVAGTHVYFIADDGLYGRELWRSDGTGQGTTLVKDMRPGPDGGGVFPLAVVGSTLYFRFIDPVNGDRSLWKTDGDGGGTVLVSEEFDRGSGDVTSFGGHLYFTRWSEQSGDELWRTDGTAGGTEQLETLSPDALSQIQWVTVAGDRLFFIKWDSGGAMELWATSGGPAEAVRLHVFSGSQVLQLAATTDRLYISILRIGQPGLELWTSNGTADGTIMLRPFDAPDNSSSSWRMTGIGDTLYFAPDDGLHGAEVWASRGTPGSTGMVADVNRNSASSKPFGFTQARNQLFFFANDPRYGLSLYRTDRTREGLRRLGAAASAQATALGDKLIFGGPNDGRGWLWISDGTVEGTRPIESPNVEGTLYGVGNFTRAGEIVYFTAGDNRGAALWKTDGTPEGTMLVRAGLHPQRLIAAGDQLFFLSRGEADYDLWVSDGTHDGTKLLQAKSPGSPGSSPFFGAYVQPGSMIALGRRLLISRYSAEHGEELWISDGTVEGTRLVKDLVPGLAGSSPRLMTRVGNTVYFVAGGWQGGFGVIGQPTDAAIWRTDGTARGTRLVRSFASWSGPSHLTAVGDQLFFVGGDQQNGYGLWRTDGTGRGTRLLLAWELSSVMVFPTDGETFLGPKIGWLTDVRGELYFQFDDRRHGPELWRSDGTVAGTWMVSDQRPGPQGAAPTNLTPFKGRLYYAAQDEATGVELFSIDESGISRTIRGSARGDIWRVIRRGDRIEVRGSSGRIFAASISSISELVLETRGGNDTVVVDAGDGDLGVRLRIEAGRGTNSLWIKSGTVTVAGGARGGRFNVNVARARP
jgi:ELWxxDGT repeat protein